MKVLHICFLLCLVIPSFSFNDYFSPNPQISISNPVEGKEYASGSTLNINLNVTCECKMDQVMLTMTNGETGKEVLLSDMTSSLASSPSGFSQSITLPTVNEETDITFEIEVMDENGEDMESEEITITVMPY